MDRNRTITWPTRDHRRPTHMRRKFVQFRVFAREHERIRSALQQLQMIAPEANLTFTDLMVAAMTSYLETLEATITALPSEVLRTRLMDAKAALLKEPVSHEQDATEPERLAKKA